MPDFISFVLSDHLYHHQENTPLLSCCFPVLDIKAAPSFFVSILCLRTVRHASHVWPLVSSPRKPWHSFEFSASLLGAGRLHRWPRGWRSWGLRAWISGQPLPGATWWTFPEGPSASTRSVKMLQTNVLDFYWGTTCLHFYRCYWSLCMNGLVPPQQITGLPWIFRGSASAAVHSENMTDTESETSCWLPSFTAPITQIPCRLRAFRPQITFTTSCPSCARWGSPVMLVPRYWPHPAAPLALLVLVACADKNSWW